MTEQPPNPPTPPEATPPKKLLIDDLSNFQFHAAYMVYSDLFDHVSEGAKQDLNLNIEDLKANKITPETFYINIARYRGESVPERRRDRLTVQTQRKKDWRMKSQKQDRIRRHKK